MKNYVKKFNTSLESFSHKSLKNTLRNNGYIFRLADINATLKSSYDFNS